MNAKILTTPGARKRLTGKALPVEVKQKGLKRHDPPVMKERHRLNLRNMMLDVDNNYLNLHGIEDPESLPPKKLKRMPTKPDIDKKRPSKQNI